MMLSHVLKKFAGKESVEPKDTPSTLAETFRKERAAALEFLPILKTRLAAPDGRLHAGTTLSAAAWLTGTSLYRSFHFQEEDRPGTAIKSDEVNREWERLIYLLEEYNFQKADIPVGRLVLAAMAAPAFFKPQAGMLHVQSALQEQYNAVMRKYDFDFLEGARAGVILCSILIQRYSGAGIIHAEAAAGTVAQRIFEAASTTPPPLKSAQ